MKSVIVILLSMAVLFRCTHADHDDDRHADEGNAEMISTTVYSKNIELFLKYPPLIAGESANLAVHLTRTGETFAPLDNSSVSLRLVVNDETMRKTIDSPEVPGLYVFAIKTPAPGTGQIILDIRSKGISEEIVIDSVHVFEKEKEMSGAHADADATINFPKEQSWKIDFASAVIEPQNFEEIIRASGNLSARPSDEQVVTARANGVVVWNDAIVPGAEIKVGQRLFVLAAGNVGPANIETQYREARLNLERAQADYERVKPLAAEKIVSQRDFLEIQTRYEQARIQFQTLSENYTQGGQTILAPSSGFVKQINVRSGEYVEGGTPLMVITKDQALQMEVEVPLRYASRLPFIQHANFRTLHDNKVYSTEEMGGKVLSYGKAIADESSLLKVYFSLKNNGSIIPGDAVEVFLKSRAAKDSIVLPVSALLEEQGNFYVLVQHTAETFEKRRVYPGGNDGRNMQILSGLEEGERVVTKGAYLIKLASQTTGISDHHHH